MSKKIGRLISLGLGIEATRGTPVDASYWLARSTITFFDRAEKALSQLGYGTIGDGNQELVALKWAEGDVEFDLQDKSFDAIAKCVFGALSTASFNGAYKHTLSILESNQHPSMTFYIDDQVDDDDLFYSLVMVNSLTLKIVPEDVVKATVNFVSKSSGDSDVTKSFVAENKFLGRHAKIKVASLVGGLDAASKLTNVKSVELNINKNVLRDNGVGTVQAADLPNQKMEITGTIVLDFEDETYKNLMLDGTYQALRIDIVNSDVTIGTTNPAFRIDLARVAFSEWDVDRPNDALSTQTIQFRALYDITTGKIINDAYVVNEVSSY